MKHAIDCIRATPYLLAAYRILWNEACRQIFETIEQSGRTEESFFKWKDSISNEIENATILPPIAEIVERVPSVAFELENILNGGFMAVDSIRSPFWFPKTFPAVVYVMGNSQLLGSHMPKHPVGASVKMGEIILFSAKDAKTFMWKYPNNKGIFITESIQSASKYLWMLHSKMGEWDLAILALDARRMKCMPTPDDIIQMISMPFSDNLSPPSERVIFVSGSMSVRILPDLVRKWLDKIIENGDQILVWDAKGVDLLIQEYAARIERARVTVYSIYDKPRNIASKRFNTVCLSIASHITREEQSQKDSKMTEWSDTSFIIWDGKSNGSYQNALRWMSLKKNVQIFLVPESRYLKESELNEESISEIFERNHEYSLSEYIESYKSVISSRIKTPSEMKETLRKLGVIEWEAPSSKYSNQISVTLNRWKTLMRFRKALLDEVFKDSKAENPGNHPDQPCLF